MEFLGLDHSTGNTVLIGLITLVGAINALLNSRLGTYKERQDAQEAKQEAMELFIDQLQKTAAEERENARQERAEAKAAAAEYRARAQEERDRLIAEARAQADKYTASTTALEDKIAFLTEEVTRLRNEVHALTGTRGELQRKLSEANDEISNAQIEHDQLSLLLKEEQQARAAERQILEAKLEALRANQARLTKLLPSDARED